MNGKDYFDSRLLAREAYRNCLNSITSNLGDEQAAMVRNFIEWAYDDGRNDALTEECERLYGRSVK